MQFNIFKNNYTKEIFLAVIIVLLVASNVFFAVNYFLQAKQIHSLQTRLAAQQTNAKVAYFLNLFVEKVLRSDQAVSFNDRLELENSVRAIGDPEILAEWEEFTGGTTEDQIQQGVKDLLQALAQKIVY